MPVFNSISLASGFNVFIIQDSVYKVEVEAEETIIPYVLTGIIGDNLVIKNRDNYCLRETRPINIYIHTMDINKIILSGSGNIESDSINTIDLKTIISGSGNIIIDKVIAENIDAVVTGSGYIKMNAEAEFIEGTISGSGLIKMTGKALDTDLLITGSGDFRFSDLEHDHSTVKITGSGSAWLFVNKTLDVSISGSGSVYYKGDPDITSSITGTGRVARM